MIHTIVECTQSATPIIISVDSATHLDPPPFPATMCLSTPGEYYDFPIRMYYVSQPSQQSVTFCQHAITQTLALDPLGSRQQALNLNGDRVTNYISKTKLTTMLKGCGLAMMVTLIMEEGEGMRADGR